MKSSKKRKWKSDLIILFGLLCICYPFAAILWNNHQMSAQIDMRQQQTEQMQDSQVEQYWKEAEAWNQELLDRSVTTELSEEELQQYNSTLDPYGDGVMGTIEIPKIYARLYIGHTTNNSVLETEVGHYQTTALPIGTKGGKSALFGHRGLPTRSLFSRLNELEKNDLIFIKVLDKDMAYKVTDILVTEPEDESYLKPDPDKDQIVLITCTPFGINNKRLIVTAERTEMPKEEEVDHPIPMEVWILGALLMAALLVIFIHFKKTKSST